MTRPTRSGYAVAFHEAHRGEGMTVSNLDWASVGLMGLVLAGAVLFTLVVVVLTRD